MNLHEPARREWRRGDLQKEGSSAFVLLELLPATSWASQTWFVPTYKSCSKHSGDPSANSQHLPGGGSKVIFKLRWSIIAGNLLSSSVVIQSRNLSWWVAAASSWKSTSRCAYNQRCSTAVPSVWEGWYWAWGAHCSGRSTVPRSLPFEFLRLLPVLGLVPLRLTHSCGIRLSSQPAPPAPGCEDLKQQWWKQLWMLTWLGSAPPARISSIGSWLEDSARMSDRSNGGGFMDGKA